MVYIFSIFGLLMGFGVGLGVINVILRNATKDQIENDKSLIWKYGSLVWLFALGGGWLGYWVYNHNFL